MGDRMCWGMVTCYGWDLLRGHPSLSACWKQSKRWWPEVQTKSFKDPEGPSSASSSGQSGRQATGRGLKKQKQILRNLMTANVYRTAWNIVHQCGCHPEVCCCSAMSTKAPPSSIEHSEAKFSEARNDLDYILLVRQGGCCIGKLHYYTSQTHVWCACDTKNVWAFRHQTYIGSRLFASPSDSEPLSVQSGHNRRCACSWTVEAGVILQVFHSAKHRLCALLQNRRIKHENISHPDRRIERAPLPGEAKLQRPSMLAKSSVLAMWMLPTDVCRWFGTAYRMMVSWQTSRCDKHKYFSLPWTDTSNS